MSQIMRRECCASRTALRHYYQTSSCSSIVSGTIKYIFTFRLLTSLPALPSPEHQLVLRSKMRFLGADAVSHSFDSEKAWDLEELGNNVASWLNGNESS